MSPTVFRYKNYRFFFFSREEERVHIHVYSHEGEAKFWLEPRVELVKNYGLNAQQLDEVKKVIEEKQDEIISAWHRHFGS